MQISVSSVSSCSIPLEAGLGCHQRIARRRRWSGGGADLRGLGHIPEDRPVGGRPYEDEIRQAVTVDINGDGPPEFVLLRRSEEHTSELQALDHLVFRPLLVKKKN